MRAEFRFWLWRVRNFVSTPYYFVHDAVAAVYTVTFGKTLSNAEFEAESKDLEEWITRQEAWVDSQEYDSPVERRRRRRLFMVRRARLRRARGGGRGGGGGGGGGGG